MKPIAKIGLGSVQFGLPYGINNQNGQTSPAEVAAILDVAAENGIRILDTASGYGTAESVLGATHKHRFSIVSKFMPPEAGTTIETQLNQSLSLLQTKQLYGYLAHRPLALLEFPQQWLELQELKKQHKIQKIGFSLNEPSDYEALKLKGYVPDLVQVPFNYFDNRFADIMQELHTQGCEIHVRSAFLQGLFFKDVIELPDFFDEIKTELSDLQKSFGDSLKGALLKYVLNFDFVDHVIIGVETKNQLLNNFESLKVAADLPKRTKVYSNQLVMPSHWPKN